MPAVADELTLVVNSNVSGAIAGLNKVEGRAQGVGSKLAAGAAKWGKRIGAVGVTAAVGVGFAASKMAMGFETAMSQIEANVGTTGADLDKLKEAALGMGKAYGVSADEAAAGLFFLQSAGLSVDDSISALETSSKMAAMGLGDMETIANGLTTAMTNWGISSEEAGDIVAKAVELGKAAPEEMTKILNQNAGAAAMVGVAFDDLASNSAYLTRVTGDANKAGTQMQGMLSKLIKPSEMGKNMLKDLGLSIEDVRDVAKDQGLHAAVAMIGESAENAGIAAGDAFAKVFEDVNAINGAGALWQAEASEIEGVFESMADRAGKVDKGFGVVADTAEFRLKSSLEGIKSALIPIGAAILEVAVPALEWLAEKLGVVIEWVKGLFDGSNEAANGVSGAFGRIWEIAQSVVNWFIENWPAIQETISTVAGVVMDIMQGLADFFGPLIADLAAFLEATFGDMVDWVRDNMPEIKETIEIVLTAAKDLFDKILPPIKALVETIFGAIKEIIRGVMNAIKGILEVVMGVIRGDWDAAWEGLKKLVDGIWDAIFGAIRGALNSIKHYLKALLTLYFNMVKAGFNKIKDGIGHVMGKVADVVKGAFRGALNWIIEKINWAIDKINGLIGGFNKLPGPDIPKIPNIPGLAHGGTLLKGGMVKVGESGPETVTLPKGATVTPAHQKAPAGIHIEHLHSGADPHELAAAIGWEMTKRGL